ncbi:EH signature domain-containing protein [Pleurocapsa sp. FMAR1]|uniref:EH signature domain-containing protein n=1 Tax=Pleurocapsa sp. FMAR1 TaxID=3040204 RepID=UPI0029C8379E|nr:EH signature domain-containing protein [Pleurocapsa sp. FMAR1]
MKTIQQIKAVELVLTLVDPKLGAEHPGLINWLSQHYGSPVTNSRWNELSSEAKAAMRKWLGAVSYQDFQKLANLVLDRVSLEKHEHRRLKSRSGFWSNYSDRFERIQILLPESSVNILGNYLNNQDVSILLNDGSDPTEICVFDFGNWFVVEFFRGDGSETSIIRKDNENEQTLFHTQLSVKRLRCLERDIHDHEFCWQYFCEQLLRSKGIFPNDNIQDFEGLPDQHRKYNRQTGLPKPSSENMRRRDRSLEYWRQDIAELEREAKQYCDYKQT